MSGEQLAHVSAAHAPGEHHAGVDAAPAKGAVHADHEFSGDTVHSDEFPAACSSQPCAVHDNGTGASAKGGAIVDASDDDLRRSIQHHFTKARRVVEVKQCDPSALFRLSSFADPARTALDLFLRRHAKRTWMQNQRLFVQKAALAAAHEAMHLMVENEYDDGDVERFRDVETGLDAVGFLNCGIRVKPRKGFPPFWICGQVEHCPRCNLNFRVKPAKYEFLPAFDHGKVWWSITVMGRSSPRNCGVKIQIGRDANNQPIFKFLFRPTDHLPRLFKFGVEDVDARPQIVGDALLEFMNWLTDGKYFDGLHVLRDLALSFFPDARSATGVGHTVNCHYHGYGNSSRQFTGKEAERMWWACAKLLHTYGGGQLAAYPDIALRLLPTPAALASAINYVIKPFKFADWYLNGLKHGCPVAGLNHEFFQSALDLKAMLSGTEMGSVFGNMSQKSRPYYIGKPPPIILKQHQVQRFLELQASDEAFAWEYERYDNHLTLAAARNKKHVSRVSR